MKNTILALAVMALALTPSNAVAGTSVSVNINGYLPAPPGVQVLLVGGRPCYRDRGRVVYLERDGRHSKHGRGHAYGHREHREGHREHQEGRGDHGHKGRHD